MLPPSTLTVVVPFTSCDDIEMMIGYGMGTGPPGDGVLQTSGSVDFAIPIEPLWTSEFDVPFT